MLCMSSKIAPSDTCLRTPGGWVAQQQGHELFAPLCILRRHARSQALSGSASPQSLVPASQRLPSGLRYDSVSGYAKAAAVTGGKQLLGLGEAGYKYVSSQYGQWRSGSWEGASTR